MLKLEGIERANEKLIKALIEVGALIVTDDGITAAEPGIY